ncbi:hypothetical protein A3K86_20060 [Photobacterium jeanii]|uniref:Beta-lactamase-related domain-containing protein n=1 Tax=Photobacterium jeanii TaxID=858640 RepID=A0A178K3G0_9GAMM|nr:serine hydrolase domain-containing protein [Photobacterium jeanii]OAN11253.1 hypothetical protein A3K86_20060 [Photobacterium jeanii]PST90773.1 hypothetical protein C9I91_09170 [Photobacterium jeanii]
MRLPLYSFAACLVAQAITMPTAAFANDASTPSVEISATTPVPSLKESVANYLKHQNQHGQFSGNVLIADNNTILFEQSLGLADVQSNRAINNGNLFKVGSITKQFTAAAILRLAEQGKLSLTTTVDRYFPNLAKGDKITVLNLLDHTAGLQRDTAWRDSPKQCRSQAMIRTITKTSHTYPPALRYNFSHANYLLLGSIIEQVSGIDYNTFIDQEFLRPLDMKDSSMKLTLSFQLAKSYEISGLINAHITPTECAWAAGGLITTSHDLLQWNRALHSGNVVSQSSLETMYRHQLGMIKSDYNGAPLYSMEGNIDGFKALLTYQPQQERSIIALSNYQNTNLSLLTTDLLRLTNGESAINKVSAPKSDTVTWQVNKDLVGNYQDNLGVPLQIVYEEGALTAKVNQANIPLVVKNSHSLYAEGIDNKIRVNRHANNTTREIVFFSRDGRYLSRFVRVE